MIKCSQLNRVAIAAMVIGIGLMTAGPATAQGRPRMATVSQQRVVSLGRLIRSGQNKNGTPRFAQLDEAGSISAYVVSPAGINLGGHVNQEVAITARPMRQGSGPIPSLLAERVELMSEMEGSSDGSYGETQAIATTVAEGAGIDEPQVVAEAPVTQLSTMGTLLEGSGVMQPTSATRGIGRGAFGSAVLPAAADEILPVPAAANPEPVGSGVPAALGSDIDQTVGEFIDDNSMSGGTYLDGGLSTCTSCGMSQGTCGMSCGSCGDGCCPCGPSGRFWLRGEYLLWWTNAMNTPPLVTTSTAGTTAANAGVLGLNSTSTVYGGDILDASRNGGRFRLGTWLDPCQWRGFEVDYFFLGQENEDFSQTSTGTPILARPFYNTLLNSQDSELVAFPGTVAGTIGVRSESEFMSVAPRFRFNLKCQNFGGDPCSGYALGGQRVDWTLGYRYYNLEERLRISEQLTTTANGGTTNFNLIDDFQTRNQFHGAELGLNWDCYRGPWSLELASRFALGNNQRSVTINGSTVSSTGGTTFTDAGGLLALPSNIGSYTDDDFVVIPEMAVNLGYQLSPSLRFLVGYTFIYWGNVVRPGDVIDTRVNTDLLPPALNTTAMQFPVYTLKESDFWAHGLSLGLDWRW